MALVSSFTPIVCVVGFHHARQAHGRGESYTKGLTIARGPEIESWFGIGDSTDPAAENDWSFIPFMALSDGAHAYDARQSGARTDAEHEPDLQRIFPTSPSVEKLRVPALPLLSLAYRARGKWTPMSF